MRKVLTKNLESYGNHTGIKIINDLTALYFIFNSYGYSKKICLASHSLSLFFEKNELLEVTFTTNLFLLRYTYYSFC